MMSIASVKSPTKNAKTGLVVSLTKRGMQYNYLGERCGLKVSAICLGTMTFGNSAMPGQLDEAGAFAILDAFAAAGGNFIDTADVYASGESEALVGRWLTKSEQRDRFVVATKLRFPAGASGDPNALGLSRKHIILGLEASLARLQTPYVDLLQTHCWDEGTPVEETVATITDLQKQGKLLYWGVSNVTGWQLQKIISTCEARGVQGPVSVQMQYNLLCRQPEWELQPCAVASGLGILPWSPLKGGWLSGKIRRDAAPDASTRVGWASQTKPGLQSAPEYDTFASDDRVWALLDAMSKIAAARGGSVAQVALRWLLQRSGVPSVVIGIKTPEQLSDNLGALQLELTAQDMSELDALSGRLAPLPYPYEMVFRCQTPRARK